MTDHFYIPWPHILWPHKLPWGRSAEMDELLLREYLAAIELIRFYRRREAGLLNLPRAHDD